MPKHLSHGFDVGAGGDGQAGGSLLRVADLPAEGVQLKHHWITYAVVGLTHMTIDDLPRVGLIGTGPWAAAVHAPAIARSSRVRFGGVWGRNPDAGRAFAEEHGTTRFEDPQSLIDIVDIVVFAVPPAVQHPLALAAADAGRHLLLEKPIGFSTADAVELAEAADRRGLASVVFFTALIAPATEQWVERTRADGAWLAQLRNIAQTLVDPANPFGASPWRHEHGQLWDSAPHEVAMALRLLGPVQELACIRGPGDLSLVMMRHLEGSSEIALRGDAPVIDVGTRVLTRDGLTMPPEIDWGELAAAAAERSLAHLADAVRGKASDSLPDARFAVEVTRVLEAAELSAREGIRVSLAH